MDTIDNWLLDINKKEEEKSFFYKSPNTYINVDFYYISAKNVITKKKSIPLTLQDENTINKNELIHLISKYKTQSYRLLDILIYQMNLPANDLIYIDNYEGLKSIKLFDDIKLDNTIEYFKDLTTLYILLYEKKKKYNNTRRIYIKSKHKHTKRLY
tara:strand:+ start:1249 stop:1716 length:468 start_codon:yes stop_codon:yes gene_type:complete